MMFLRDAINASVRGFFDRPTEGFSMDRIEDIQGNAPIRSFRANRTLNCQIRCTYPTLEALN